MNEPIDLYLPIDKYFKKTDDCVQFVDNGKTPYTAAQVIQKANHAVLASGTYTDSCKE